MTIDPKQYPKLARLVDQHDKNCEVFLAQTSAFFHPYAVELCRRIQKGIPKFEGCYLAMRELYLEPMDLQIPVICTDTDSEHNGETCMERLQNIWDYIRYERNGWTINLPEDCLAALIELDELSNYIDDNYSMVGELCVTLVKEKAPKLVRKLAVKEHKRLMKMDFNRIAADIRTYHTMDARWRHIKKYLPQLQASNPRFDKEKFIAVCLS